jgi:hypothetical protein
LSQAYSLLRYVPRNVAVIANRQEPDWAASLRGCDVQFMTVSVFKRSDGKVAHETEGSLYVPHISLGFFSYYAPSRSFRMPSASGIGEGDLQIEDPFGVIGAWTVRYATDGVWVTKQTGDPGIPHNSLLQVLKTHTGRITMRLPA